MTSPKKVKLLNGTRITHCPRCKHRDLLDFEGDAFCLKCNWDSIEANVDSLGLNRLFSELIFDATDSQESEGESLLLLGAG